MDTPRIVLHGRALPLHVASGCLGVRLGQDIAAGGTAGALVTSEEAVRTLDLAPEDARPDDVEYAARVDLFDFAMEVHRRNGQLEMRATPVS